MKRVERNRWWITVAWGLVFSVWTSFASASFVPLSTEPVLLTPEPLMAQDVKVADLDGDGNLDIAVAAYGRPNAVYLNVNGDFTNQVIWKTEEADYTLGLAVCEIDGKGCYDLFAANSIGQSNRVYYSVGGPLSSKAGWTSTDARWTNVALAFDFDGDGWTDIFAGGSGDNVIYRNEGGRLGEDPFWVSPKRIETRDAIIADLDGDGSFFLITGNVGVNRVYRIAGGLPEDDPVWTSPDWQPTYSVDVADYDGDGDLDLAVGNLDAPDQVFANTDGTFGDGPVWSSSDSTPTRSICWSDFNEDGYPDLAVGTFRSEANLIYLNSGGSLQTSPSWRSDDEDDTTSILCTDIDGNGSSDLLAANQDGYVVLYRSLLHSAPFVFATSPEDGATNVGRSAPITVILYDYDDDIDTGSIELVVNGEKKTVSITSTSDGTTVTYNPLPSFAPSETVEVTVRAADLAGNRMPDYHFSFTTAENSAPLLSSGTVTPPAGDTNTLFIYSVYYIDVDADPPAEARVFIVSEQGEVRAVDMETLSSTPADASYQAAASLDPGQYYYYFEFEDEWGAQVRLPATDYYTGPSVSRYNWPPQLSSPSVSPPSGSVDTTFWFSIGYFDEDGDIASTAQVVVSSGTQSYVWDMVLTDGLGSSGTYSYCSSLPAGSYSHYFRFTDARGASARLPESGSYSGPVVTGENTPCILSFGGVSPSIGTTHTEFTFRVHFLDRDGDTPSVATLYLNSKMTVSAKLTLGNGLLYDGDYTYRTKLSSPVDWYYFRFVDTHGDEARLPAEGYFFGPNLAGEENRSLLDSGGVDPIFGAREDTFRFSVHYYDVAGGAPIEARLFLKSSGWSATEPMEPMVGEAPANGTYVADLALEEGSYQYWFAFTDSQGAQVRLPDTGEFSGPYVATSNHSPVLTDVELSPGCGSAGSAFSFSAHYFDQDGDEPGIARLILFGEDQSFSIVPDLVSGTAANGTYGAELALSAGEYRFCFSFVDGKGAKARYPAQGRASGPTVGDFDLSLSANSSHLKPSEVLLLTANAKNNSTLDFSVTACVAILLPTGELIYFPDWGTAMTGIDVFFPAHSAVFNYPILSITIPESGYFGAYTAYAAFFAPGDFECRISDIATVSWRVEASAR